ncbi:MAG: hypothetical protein Q8N62_07395 [Candidatus Omnitrophota bacterium]|nr:hypothetical protein [Candidatus Omnitrophota bacterium]
MHKSKFSPWIRFVALLVTAVFLPQQLCLAGITDEIASRLSGSVSSFKSSVQSSISTAQSYATTARSAYTTASNVYNAVKSVTGISARSFISPLSNINTQSIKSIAGIATAVLTRNPQAGMAVTNTNWTKTISSGLPEIKNAIYDKAIWARDKTILKPGFNDSLEGQEHWKAVGTYFMFITGPGGAAKGLLTSAGGLVTTSVARYVPFLAARGGSWALQSSRLIEWAGPKTGQGINYIRPASKMIWGNPYVRGYIGLAGTGLLINTGYGLIPGLKSRAFDTFSDNNGRAGYLMNEIRREEHLLGPGKYNDEMLSELSEVAVTPEGIKRYFEERNIPANERVLAYASEIASLNVQNQNLANDFNWYEKTFTGLAGFSDSIVTPIGEGLNNAGVPFVGDFVKSAGSFNPLTGLSIGGNAGANPSQSWRGFADFVANPIEAGIGLRRGAFVDGAWGDYHSNYRCLGEAAGSLFILRGGGGEALRGVKSAKTQFGLLSFPSYLSKHKSKISLGVLTLPLAAAAWWQAGQTGDFGPAAGSTAVMTASMFLPRIAKNAITRTDFSNKMEGTGGGSPRENIKSVPLPSSIEVNTFELPRAETVDSNLKNELSGIKLEALNTEDLGAIGQRIAKQTKNILAGKGNQDITIDNLVAHEFASLAKNRNFNIRPDQLAFTYIVAAHLAKSNLGMPTKGLTAGLEMSGGKMDGYLSGIKIALDITQRIDSKAESKAKNIYIDPDSKNLQQIKTNPTVGRLAKDYNVFTIEEAHTPVLIGEFKPDKPQIYLMENFDAKSIGLAEKKEAKILSGVTGVIANEIQLILVDADLIKGPREGIYSKLTDENAKGLVMQEVKLFRVIAEEINKEAGLHNNGIEGIIKTRSLLNGHEIRSEYQLKPESSRKILESISDKHKDLLKDLGYDRAEKDFLNLIDLSADALFNKERGKHYWITSDKEGKYVDYRIADSDGTERPNTRFGAQEVAGLIALKEGATDVQVADNLLHKPTDRITTTELLKEIGIDKAIFGSATTEGQGKTLNEMGVSTIRVTPEEKVDWNKGVNKLEVISTDMPDVAAAVKNAVELIKSKEVTQVAVTDISARKLEEVRAGILKAMDEGTIPRSEIEFVTGENRQLQGRKFEEIRENNKVDPTKKPILIIQGMGAGVNTFNAPNAKYKVALIKMGIAPKDTLTQLSGRINKDGRADGTFSVIINEKQDKSITTQEKEGLSKISSPEAKKEAVLGISEKITKELDAQGVSRLQQEARKLVDVSRQQAEVTDKDVAYLQSEYLKKIKQRTGAIAQGDIATAAHLEKYLSQRGLSQPVEALKFLGLVFDGRLRGTQDELTLRGKRFLNFLANFEEQIMKRSANPYQFLKIARDQVRIKRDVFLKQLNDPDNVIADLPDRLSNLAKQEDFLNKVLEDGQDIPAPYVILHIWSLLNTPILKPQILEALQDQNIFIKSKDVENLKLRDIPQYSQLKDEEVKKIKSDLFQYLLNVESIGGIGALDNLIKEVSIKETDVLAASEDQIRIWLNAENFKNGDLNKLFNSGYGKELVLKLVKETRGNPALLKAWLTRIINTDMADLKTDFTEERVRMEFYKRAKESGFDDNKIERIIKEAEEPLTDSNSHFAPASFKLIAEAIFKTNSPARLQAIRDIKVTLSVLPTTVSTAPALPTVDDSEAVKAAEIATETGA